MSEEHYIKSPMLVLLELSRLIEKDYITEDEYYKLYDMARSKDNEMRQLALTIVNPLRQKRIYEKDKKEDLEQDLY